MSLWKQMEENRWELPEKAEAAKEVKRQATKGKTKENKIIK